MIQKSTTFLPLGIRLVVCPRHVNLDKARDDKLPFQDDDGDVCEENEPGHRVQTAVEFVAHVERDEEATSSQNVCSKSSAAHSQCPPRFNPRLGFCSHVITAQLPLIKSAY